MRKELLLEVVRRVYLAVRDLDWNTLPGEQEDLNIAADARSFVNGVARVDVRDE